MIVQTTKAELNMGKKTRTHIALQQSTPIRLQEYGVGIFPTLSTKSALKKAIKKRLLFVNGKRGETATYITGGEVITLHQSEEKPKQKKLKLQLEVVYEDDYLAIINKPAGILVSGNSFKTIVNALAQNLIKSEQNDAVKPQPTHRLDYATTGLLLIGKTSASIIALNKLFEKKLIKKTYFAVTIGTIKKQGVLNFSVDEKNAISNFETLETVASERFQYLNLVRLLPETGRRHQLRKHLSALENPILGDKAYGKEGLILNGKGLYLHAFSLEFIHPFTNEKLCIEKKLPAKFNKIFNYEK